MAHTALSDHWLDLAMQSSFDTSSKIHFESICIFQYFGIDEYLIWFAEAKGHAILLHELAVLLGPLTTHVGRDIRKSFGRFGEKRSANRIESFSCPPKFKVCDPCAPCTR